MWGTIDITFRGRILSKWICIEMSETSGTITPGGRDASELITMG